MSARALTMVLHPVNAQRIHIQRDRLQHVVCPEPVVTVVHVTLVRLVTTPVVQLQVVNQLEVVLIGVSIQSRADRLSIGLKPPTLYKVL